MIVNQIWHHDASGYRPVGAQDTWRVRARFLVSLVETAVSMMRSGLAWRHLRSRKRRQPRVQRRWLREVRR